MGSKVFVGALTAAALVGAGMMARPLLSAAGTSDGDRSVLVPVVPARLLDTRPGAHTIDDQFAGAGPLGAGAVLDLVVGGRGGVPTDATAVVLNVTAVDPTAPTYLTLWPAGAPQPLASNLNPSPGAPPTPNLVTVGVGAGNVSIFNLAGNVHVLADVTGYYTAHDHDDRYYTEDEAIRLQPVSVQRDALFPDAVTTAGPATVAKIDISSPAAGVVDVQVDSQVWADLGTNDPNGHVQLALCATQNTLSPASGCGVVRDVFVLKPTGVGPSDATYPITLRKLVDIPAGKTSIYVNVTSGGGFPGGLWSSAHVTAVLTPAAPFPRTGILQATFTAS
jgi:hypothetical protein